MLTELSTIHVRIHRLRQLFDSIDHSPFRERDLTTGVERVAVLTEIEAARQSRLVRSFHTPRRARPDVRLRYPAISGDRALTTAHATNIFVSNTATHLPLLKNVA